jgi:hypothetical protein
VAGSKSEMESYILKKTMESNRGRKNKSKFHLARLLDGLGN